jgi:tetratricopeptide (TPR) repeat protein
VTARTPSEPPAASRREVVADLEEERRFLLDSLRDLDREREAGDIAEDDYETLRDDYTARAAAVLRALEESRSATPRRAASRTEPRAPARRWRRPGLALALVVIVAVGAGVGLAASSGPRVRGQARPASNDSPTARHLNKAQQLEGQGKAVEALKEYDQAIKADPTNVVALTYRGWLLARAGLTDQAMTSLDRALTVNRNYPDAHFFRGMVLYRGRNDAAGAIGEFETYLASNPPPEAAAAVREVLDQARRDAAKPGPPPPG